MVRRIKPSKPNANLATSRPADKDFSRFNEPALIDAARQNDGEAFDQLVLLYRDWVYRRALWLLKEKEAAEDLTQDTFLQAYRNLPGFQGNSLRAWLYRIVTNACYDEFRRSKRQPSVSLIAVDDFGEEVELSDWLLNPETAAEELVEQAEMNSALHQCLDELPSKLRETVMMVDFLEFDYAEAAHLQSIPIGTVKSRLARGRSHLRKRIESMPEFFPGMKAPETGGFHVPARYQKEYRSFRPI